MKLYISKLTKIFKNTTACKDISLDINDGEFFVLLGPSGCGKTTILRLIAGLERPEKGDIKLNDRSITDVLPKDRNIAMVFQNYALYPNMTVRKNLEFPLKMKRTKRSDIKDTVEKIAVLLRLTPLLDKKPSKLSGGEQQRVAMGRALVRKPCIFLLDEPLSNLDAKLRQHLRVELARIQRELGITTIYVTHDQQEAMTLADRIAVLRGGVIQQIGTPEEIYNRPANLFTARFIGYPEINTFDAEIRDSKLMILNNEINLASHHNREKRLIAAIRPEDIGISDKTTGLRASIELKQIQGPDIILHVNLEKQQGVKQHLRIRTIKLKSRLISNANELYIRLDPKKLLFFNPENNQLLTDVSIFDPGSQIITNQIGG